jgi:hypothetical protein
VINSQSIYEIINLPQNHESETLNERVLVEYFKILSPQDKNSLLQSYLCQNINFLEDNVNLKIDMFP